MKRKSLLMLPCIAAVAAATFVGTKAINSDASRSGLLMANIEAMSKGEPPKGTIRSCCREGGGTRGDRYYVCQSGTTFPSTYQGASNQTVYSCTGSKQIPKLSFWQSNWSYCVEY